MKSINELLNLELIITKDNIEEMVSFVLKNVHAPYVSAYKGAMGNSTIFIDISLLPKKDWQYGYIQNSPYGTFELYNGTLLLFNRSMKIGQKFRKTKVSDIKQACDKMNAFVKSCHLKHESKQINLKMGYLALYGGTDKRNGMWFAGKLGLDKIILLSKKNPNRIYRFVSDNYTNFGNFVIRNGKIGNNISMNMAVNFLKHPITITKIKNMNNVDNIIFKVLLLTSDWS